MTTFDVFQKLLEDHYYLRIQNVEPKNIWTLSNLVANVGDSKQGKIPKEFIKCAKKCLGTDPIERFTKKENGAITFWVSKHNIVGSSIKIDIEMCLCLGPTPGTFVVGEKIHRTFRDHSYYTFVENPFYDEIKEVDDDGDSLPYPHITKQQLDKELDEMQR